MATHIPQGDVDDSYIWCRFGSEDISSKDVYALLAKRNGSLVTTESDQKFWSKLWALDVTPK